jgi:hypothetical protein
MLMVRMPLKNGGETLLVYSTNTIGAARPDQRRDPTSVRGAKCGAWLLARDANLAR